MSKRVTRTKSQSKPKSKEKSVESGKPLDAIVVDLSSSIGSISRTVESIGASHAGLLKANTAIVYHLRQLQQEEKRKAVNRNLDGGK